MMHQFLTLIKCNLRLVLLSGYLMCYMATSGLAQQTDSLQVSSGSTYFTGLLDDFNRFQSRPLFLSKVKKEHSIMLPSPSPRHSSPMFCRLEDQINEGNKIQCLFRLGSLSYVNFLEQKGDHQRLMLEQIR